MSTMTKSEVLQELESSRKDWLKDDSYTVHSIDSVALADSGIYVDNMPMNEKAISKMLYRMQLTNKFIDYKNQVDSVDFKTVFDNIVRWNQGKQIITRSNGTTVSDVFFYRGEEGFNPQNRLELIIDGVHGKLSEMSDDIEIHKFEMDLSRKNIKFSTVDPTTKFNAIGSDEWVLGSILSIGLTEAFASPYYGRLICTNGMVDGIKMRKTSISGKGYTESAISQMISKGVNLKKLVGDHIKEVSSAATGCDASLSEYLSFRKIMSEGLTDEQKHLSDMLFPLDHIEDAYGGKEVFDQNDQWKSTAKSGATVYELLNDITKWTTHDKTVNNQTMKDRLNEKASTWFIKGKWHNRNVAPNVSVRRAPRFNDSVAVL
jgi:hypothetical protein